LQEIMDEHLQPRQLNRLIPSAQLAILPAVTLFAMFQNPTEFNKVVLHF